MGASCGLRVKRSVYIIRGPFHLNVLTGSQVQVKVPSRLINVTRTLQNYIFSRVP
jgi:hypothetical protein